MPSIAGNRDERPRADVVIGDRYGTSCVVVADTVRPRCRTPAIR
jgi:N-formylglutamate deformylase